MSNNKKMRKLAATSIAATAAVAAIAPAAVSADTQQFTDVDKTNSHYEAITNLVAEGVITGYLDKTFKPGQDLNRYHAAALFVKALDLDVLPKSEVTEYFTDVDANHQYAGEIAAVAKAGVFKGANGEFQISKELTREAMASTLVNAFDLASYDNGNDVNINLDNVGASHKANVQILANLGITNQFGDFRPGETVTRGQFATFLYKTMQVVSDPEVVSVEAANGKELVIKFNQAVDADDAKDVTNYSLTGIDFTGAEVEVSEDGKTVTITLAAGEVIKVEEAVLSVDEIKTKKDAEVKTEKYVSLFTYSDEEAPEVVTVKAEGTEAVITFDEIVADEGTVSLNGSVITSEVHATNPYYVVEGKTLTIKNLTTEESYKVDIVGATDSSSNVNAQITRSFTVAKAELDEVKPTVTKSVSGNTLTLTFSEAVDKGTVKVGQTTVAAEHVVASEDKKTYTVDIQAAGLLDGLTFLNEEVVVSGFKDEAENAMDEYKFNATFTADKTAPKFVSAEVKTTETDENVILLTFDDEVTEGDLTAENELVVKTIDGITQSNNVVDLTADNVDYGYNLDGKDGIKDEEKNILAITYNLDERSSYSFELQGKVVEDVYGNQVSDTIDFSVEVPEYVATPEEDKKDVTISTAVPQADNVTIVLGFNKNMSDSALVSSNYKLGGKALPSNTDIKFMDNRKTVHLVLPSGSITANGTYQLEATNLVDEDGNTLEDGKVVKPLTLKENVVPTASKVSVVNSKTFTVEFSEKINTVADASDAGFTVKIAGVEANVTSASVANGKLTVTVEKNFDLNDSISVEFKNSTLVDANNNAVKDGVVTK